MMYGALTQDYGIAISMCAEITIFSNERYQDRDMEYSESFVKEHIDKWVSVWNNHDLNAVLSIYSERILNSPAQKSRQYFLKGNYQE
jgi:hypothetical protein